MFDVVQFYQQGNMTAFALFFVVGFLTQFFSKNMVVIIVTAIAVTHLVTYGNRMSEGLTDKGEEEEDQEEVEVEEDEGFEGEEDEAEEEPAEEEEDPTKEEPEKKKKKDAFIDQTGELLKKQGELMKKMSELEPLLNKAESMFKTQKTDGFQNMNKSYAEYK
jgi:FtsZ-interacting cell division protein ZipA